MSRKAFASLPVIIITLLAIAAVGGYLAFGPKAQAPLPQSQAPTSTVAQTDTSGWQTYRNEQYGFEFKYNPDWSISPINTGGGYDASKPFVLLWAGTTSDTPCQDLGCLPRSGDRDELTKGDTYESAPPLNPWFKILRVRGNKWVSIQVTDQNKICSTEAACRQYLASAPLEQGLKVNSPDYQTYNDFIDLLSIFQFISSTSTVDTSNWKIYRNDQYGFEFKYPADFYQGTSGSGSAYFQETRFQGSELTHPFIEVRTYVKGSLSNEEFIQSKSSRIEELTGKNLPLASRTNSTIGGYPMYLLSFGSTGSAYVLRNNDVFEIYWWGSSYRDTVSQILSTFTFISPTSSVDTSTWKTYRNERLGIEFRYPQSFSLNSQPTGSWKDAYGVYSYRFFELIDAQRGCYIGPLIERGLGSEYREDRKNIETADGQKIEINYLRQSNDDLKFGLVFITIPRENYTISMHLVGLANSLIVSDAKNPSSKQSVDTGCKQDFEKILSTFKLISQ